MTKFDYSGNELEKFSSATNLKAYWSPEIGPYLGEKILGAGAAAKALSHKDYETWLGQKPDKGMSSIIKEDKKEGVFPEYLEVRKVGKSIVCAPEKSNAYPSEVK